MIVSMPLSNWSVQMTGHQQWQKLRGNWRQPMKANAQNFYWFIVPSFYNTLFFFSPHFFIFFPFFSFPSPSPKQSTFLYLFNKLVHELHWKYLLHPQPVIRVVGSHFFCFCIQPKLKHLLAYLSVCLPCLSVLFVCRSLFECPSNITLEV